MVQHTYTCSVLIIFLQLLPQILIVQRNGCGSVCHITCTHISSLIMSCWIHSDDQMWISGTAVEIRLKHPCACGSVLMYTAIWLLPDTCVTLVIGERPLPEMAASKKLLYEAFKKRVLFHNLCPWGCSLRSQAPAGVSAHMIILSLLVLGWHSQ